MSANGGQTPGRIFRSPWPDVDIPDVALGTYVLKRAQERADKPAIVDASSGRTLTYGQLAAGATRLARGLQQRGFGKGDVFAIFSPNLPEYAVAFFGVAATGGTVTTANPLLTAAELAGQLNDAGARYLLTIPPLLEQAQEAARASKVREVFAFGEAEGATPFASMLAEDGPLGWVEIDPAEDVVVLPYSSGTTGRPKGVMLTHRNLVANLRQLDASVPISPDDVLIAILPFFHIYGMTCLLGQGLATGATLVTLPRFDLEQFLEALQRYGVTRAALVPPIILALAKHPLVDRYDLSSLISVASGAAPLGLDVAEGCARRVGCVVKQGFGLTETSPVTHLTPDDANRPGTVGMAAPSTEFMIVDVETEAPLGPHQPGELWVRGPQVMKGYLNQPDATAATVDENGWLRTGDVATVDDDGYVTIVDRIKELIKYKGYQVAPAELEAVLLTHASVADAAVVGSPDEEAGENPKAFVVLKDGAASEAIGGEIMAYVADRVALYKRIRLLEVVDEIPKSASGKILRRVLVERERARAALPS